MTNSAPSWSSSSIAGPIHYIGRRDKPLVASVIGVLVRSVDSLNLYGKLWSGSATIKRLFTRCVYNCSGDDHECLWFRSISLSSGAAATGGFFLNDEEEGPSSFDRHAALIIGNRIDLILAIIGNWQLYQLEELFWPCDDDLSAWMVKEQGINMIL